jgi:hypothetical protein
MNSIFGQKIVMDEDNIRSLVWKIQALAYKFLKFGLINVLLLFVASFNMFSFIISILASCIFAYVVWYKYKAESKDFISDINKKVSKKAYKPNNTKEFSDDITEDKDMSLAMRSIKMIYMFGFIQVAILTLFIFILSLEYLLFNFNCIVFLLPWIYMGLLMTSQAEIGAKDDFDISLNGGLEKLALTETTRISTSEG